MKLETFKSLVLELFQKDSREFPTNNLIKQAFDFIDIRKDGFIDQREWSKTLGLTEVNKIINAGFERK